MLPTSQDQTVSITDQQSPQFKDLALAKPYFFGNGVKKNDVQTEKLLLISAETGCI
tara:strand:- start:279 stop:446 length:168 start_codon:yes stop_codon:yes gene_type:complete